MLKSTIPRNMKIMMMMTTSEELVLVMTMMMVSLFRISRQNKSSPYFPIRCVLNQILCSLTINIQMTTTEDFEPDDDDDDGKYNKPLPLFF